MELVKYGVDPAVARMVATRLTKYGAAYLSPDGLEVMRAVMTRVNAERGQNRKTHCKRGHLYTSQTERIGQRGRRSCRTCARDLRRARRRARPAWIDVAGRGRISILAHDRFHVRELRRLRAVIVAAHPDKGGTSQRFIKARLAQDKFLSMERGWYASYGLDVPGARKAQTPQKRSA